MKYLLKFTFLLALFSVATIACSQENIFKKKNEDEKDLSGVDANRFSYGSISYGVFVPVEDADSLAGGVGFTFEINSMVKFKLFSWNSLILDYGYKYENVRMDNDSTSNPFYIDNEGLGFENQAFKTHRFQLGLAHRINFTKPIIDLGTYLDLGAWAGYNIGQRLRTDLEVESTTSGGYEELRLIQRKPDFTERVAYGLRARFGRKKIAVQAEYRLSDFYTSSEGRFQTNGQPDDNIPDMPRLSIALTLNLAD